VNAPEPAPSGAPRIPGAGEFHANNELALHVADPARAAEFYVQCCGGVVADRTPDRIEVVSGSLRLFLLRDAAPTHDRVVPSFDVPDRAAALERLRNAGCTFVPIGPHAPNDVYVRDPSGVIFDVVARTVAVAERLPCAVPEIPVSDVVVASEYYRVKLGFSVDWLAADIALAGISRGQCRLFLAGPTFREASGNASPASTWLNLDSIAEVDDLHSAWRSNDAILLSDPEAKPWGLHEFTAADPDGNRFRVFHDFATPTRGRAGTPAP
jgi:catechol 2,3-dioxygenase-like lactoylglutathione lyase family enzyme